MVVYNSAINLRIYVRNEESGILPGISCKRANVTMQKL